MRELKFRVWLSYHNTMDFISNLYGFEELGITEDSKETPIMQYTGLKDKNGKEIYENDFLRTPNGLSPMAMLANGVGSHSIGLVEWDPNSLAWVLDDEYLSGSQCEDLEIIGNIYENPEVLQ